MELLPRFFKESKLSYFLFGPRGTGKSTWLKKRYPGCLLIDLLEPDVFRGYSARPEKLRELVDALPDDDNLPNTTIIIDEVQKVPDLLDPVHALIEEKPGLRFILTGSSSRKLKRTSVDLLSGRAALRSMHPFMAAELGARFDLNDALHFGLVPVVYSSPDRAETLKAYIELYIKEEVMMEGLIRNVGNFSRFLEAISFSHGSVLNVSNVARECEVERKTVHGYIEILHELLLAFSVPVFTKRAKRAVVKHPKFYIFDPGVYGYLRPRGPLDRPEEIGGPALEGLIAQHIRAWLDYSFSSSKLYFWRTKGGSEVDFIIYGAEGFWAIEVKNSQKVHTNDLRGLLSFTEDYPECTPLLLYRGKDAVKIKGVLCLPCERFLHMLTPENKTIVFDG